MNTNLKKSDSGLISGVDLEGVELHQLDKNVDSRGSFTEIFHKSWKSCIDPVQWSAVESGPGVFRGMHYHSRHDEYFCLITGRCLVGLKDLRAGSPTENGYSLYELNEDSPAAITFPRGILHGWYFFERAVHIQSVSESYNDYSADDNLGCRWNDKDLGIPWPFKDAVVSERAANFSSFKQLMVQLKIS